MDQLVAPDTVNTMPMATLHATAEQSEVQGATGDQDPSDDLEALADAGIDMSDVTDTLLREGIEKFVEPFDELIRGVESAREAAVTKRPPTISSSIPDELEPLIVEHIERAQRRTGSASGARTPRCGRRRAREIANRLGWLTISDAMLDQVPDLTASRRSAAPTGTSTSAARHGRLEPGSTRFCGAASPTRPA